jgi:hypothetical protein
MAVNGLEANSLLAAQAVSIQRQPAQDVAGADARNRTLDDQGVTEARQAQRAQTRQAVPAAETDDSGRLGEGRPDLPRDAQQAARDAQDRAGDTPPRRGSAVNIFA